MGRPRGAGTPLDWWEKEMIYELRIYKCVPEKLEDVIKRFEQPVLPIWKELGIEPSGFWTNSIDGVDQIVYMIPWTSDAEREEKMRKFATDPRWLEAKATSEAGGPIVASFSSQMMQATSFSAMR
jgi:NIPSNAP